VRPRNERVVAGRRGGSGGLPPTTLPLARFARAPLPPTNSKTTANHLCRYFRSRRLFKTFDDEFVNGFFEHGLVEKEGGGVGLAFEHSQEAHMYKTTPTETPIIGGKNGILKQYDAVDAKGTFLYSNRMNFLDERDVAFLKGNFTGFQFEAFDNEHFWPMIDPDSFCSKIEDITGGGGGGGGQRSKL
jgi:hypothetical protein